MLRISRIIAASSAMLCGIAVSATAQPTGRVYAGAAVGAFRGVPTRWMAPPARVAFWGDSA